MSCFLKFYLSFGVSSVRSEVDLLIKFFCRIEFVKLSISAVKVCPAVQKNTTLETNNVRGILLCTCFILKT